ncbi:ABC transporter permease [Facklamia lactis]|uniref:ABC transporter permease n=1 Tax=Facklamia lactis TaxID=2749967 RepID=UPI0018CCC8DF|nr:ABC transporter permease [Facklamia lactis]MBG9979739.1 ABC transporter permease [Facklamia lactis]
MKINNHSTIWKLSYKSLIRSQKRNRVAIVAMILTCVLFTSLFTMVINLNHNLQEHQFKLAGGKSHGTYKQLTREQVEAITKHPAIQSVGERLYIGRSDKGIFSKVPAEIAYSSEESARSTFDFPSQGRLPINENEVALDREVLNNLKLEGRIGEEVPLTFQLQDSMNQAIQTIQKNYKLVGISEYNELASVHKINLSQVEVEQLIKETEMGDLNNFYYDLNIQLKSSRQIEETMNQIIQDLGYQSQDPKLDNYLKMGVNWAYTSAQLDSKDQLPIFLIFLLLLVIILSTGYLLISNIFQISVQNDIRYYGLLKTIGLTKKQLRRLLVIQAILLSLVAIPLGILIGYGLGIVFLPYIIRQTIIENQVTQVAFSPWIAIAGTLFTMMTVFLSCLKPGRIVGKVSAIEAVRYRSEAKVRRTIKQRKAINLAQMGLVNLRRNLSKFILVVLSLTLSTILLSSLMTLTLGFDMDRYLEKQLSGDFLVAKNDYFKLNHFSDDLNLEDKWLNKIHSMGEGMIGGSSYTLSHNPTIKWMDVETLKRQLRDLSPEEKEAFLLNHYKKNSDFGEVVQIQGFDPFLLSKLEVIEGDLQPLIDGQKGKIALVLETDDFGQVIGEDYLPIGSQVDLSYAHQVSVIDPSTQKEVKTQEGKGQLTVKEDQQTSYEICAHVIVPYSISLRYSIAGSDAYILSTERLKQDSQLNLTRLFYLFDSHDTTLESQNEAELESLTASPESLLHYQSKQTLRKEFNAFRKMFILIGGTLCFLIAFIGVINYINSMLTSFMTRRHELASLRAIGMTRYQMQKLLTYESIYYTATSLLLSVLFVTLLNPLLGQVLESVFWFYSYQRNFGAIWLMAPCLILLSFLLPSIICRIIEKQTIVEQLAETY